MTHAEIADWFGAMLTELPPDLPANTRLQAEDIIEPFFQNPLPNQEPLRNLLAHILVETARTFILESRPNPSQRALYNGRSRTLLNHFRRIWLLRRQEYQILNELFEP
jgi:hypothetical protein